MRLWQTWSMPLWTSRQLWLPLAEIRFSIFCSLDGMQFRSYEFALNATFSCPSLRGCGLSRRCAPRNDMQKLAACSHNTWALPGCCRGTVGALPEPPCTRSPIVVHPTNFPENQCFFLDKPGKIRYTVLVCA